MGPFLSIFCQILCLQGFREAAPRRVLFAFGGPDRLRESDSAKHIREAFLEKMCVFFQCQSIRKESFRSCVETTQRNWYSFKMTHTVF